MMRFVDRCRQMFLENRWLFAAAAVAGVWIGITEHWTLGVATAFSPFAVLALRRARWFDPNDDIGWVERRISRAHALLDRGDPSAEKTPEFIDGQESLFGVAPLARYHGKSFGAHKVWFTASRYSIEIYDGFLDGPGEVDIEFSTHEELVEFVEENSILWINL